MCHRSKCWGAVETIKNYIIFSQRSLEARDHSNKQLIHQMVISSYTIFIKRSFHLSFHLMAFSSVISTYSIFIKFSFNQTDFIKWSFHHTACSSNGHSIKQCILQMVISSYVIFIKCHFIMQPILHMVILSVCHFHQISFQQIVISSCSLFFKWSFHLMSFSSNLFSTNSISSYSLLIKWPCHQKVISSKSSFNKRPFHLNAYSFNGHFIIQPIYLINLWFQNDKLTKCLVEKIPLGTSGQNDKLAKWQVGKMTSWQNDTLAKWQVGKITSW